MTPEESSLDWDNAKGHFDEVFEQYKELLGIPGVNTAFAISRVFNPILTRFNEGERSQELYEEMLGVE